MKSLNIMIKPASSLCNMGCKYCFYADVSNMRKDYSFGIMDERTMSLLLKNIYASLMPGDRVNFAFQGGEPTLAGLDYFNRFFEIVSKWESITLSYALQTNGLLIDDEWCGFLKKHKFLVGVSFDILPSSHNEARVDKNNVGTYDRVLKAIELLNKYDVDYNILCTLTNSIARHPQSVWKELVRLDIKYTQFTPCLGELSAEDSVYALTPKRFCDFYTQLFMLWHKDYSEGKYRSIKLFDDIVNQIILGYPTMCGNDGKCRPQFVVEADGSVYPCDFYCLDRYRLGNLTVQTAEEVLLSENTKIFLESNNKKEDLCKECQYLGFCGGNCKRMRKEICIAKNKSFCGYRQFLDNCGEALALIARELAKNNH